MSIRASEIKRDQALKRLNELLSWARRAREESTLVRQFASRYSRIETLVKTFEESLLKIVTSLDDDVLIEEQDNLRLQFDNSYFEVVTIYEELVPKVPDDLNIVAQTTTSSVRLPKIDLMTFDGSYQSWPRYFNYFNTLVHKKESLSNLEKFHYLLSSLTGEALSLVQGFTVDDKNYKDAYSTLIERYQCKRKLGFAYWEEILHVSVSTAKPSGLRGLLDTFAKNLAALKNLGFKIKEWDFILFHTLITKLDQTTRISFERLHPANTVPSYESLRDYIDKECQAFERTNPSRSCASAEGINVQHIKGTATGRGAAPLSRRYVPRSSSALIAGTDAPSRCDLCSGTHALAQCQKFLSLPPQERYGVVRERHVCLNCLRGAHLVGGCRSTSTCRFCRSRHHSLLHFTDHNPRTAEVEHPNMGAEVSAKFEHSSAPVNVLANVMPEKPMVLLSTAIVDILDFGGNYQQVRVLLDSASQANFITGRCAQRLGLSRMKSAQPIRALGGMVSNVGSFVSCSIKSKVDPLFGVDVDAYILPKICGRMPSEPIDARTWEHIQHINLADPEFSTPGQVDMLLGGDPFSYIIQDGRLPGGGDRPCALNTRLGWILMGRVNRSLSAFVSVLHVSVDDRLEISVKRLWELEDLPATTEYSPAELSCEKLFIDSYKRDDSGRYTVALPFSEPEPSFVDSRSVALRRFQALERRLRGDSKLCDAYHVFMQDYLDCGHMEKVPFVSNMSSKMFYIPHHCILKPDSTTTKLRVVFDASASSLHSRSLNDTLFVGPKLQKNIATILLNFRMHSFVITADIKQMYRQIKIASSHRDYQRIVWRFSEHDPISDYRLCTVTYGISSAPFLALRTLLQLAQDERVAFPEASSVLESDVYVDDIVTGCSSLQCALDLQSQLTTLLRRGGFELRKWASNSPLLLKNVESSHCQSISFDTEEDSPVKILGLYWQPSFDCFSYQVQPLDRSCTKRVILSELARVFDPLGFLTPLTFYSKCLIQQLWSLGLEWDQPAPENIMASWNRYKSQLPLISQLRIPRQIVKPERAKCELHGFGDASELGYGAVAYFRFIDLTGHIQTFLICARSKVAPLKRISLPRLELCAAVLLSDLLHFVQETYSNKFEIHQTFAWSDSMVALAWLKSPPARWKTFVANRVSHAQDMVSPSCWHHVSSSDNPADCSSRGLMPLALVEHPLWWCGPSWLAKPAQCWPHDDIVKNNMDSLCEERKPLETLFISVDSIDAYLDRYSSLGKIKRITAYVLRFNYNSRHPSDKRTGALSQIELQTALNLLVKQVQRLVFRQEIENLKSNKNLSRQFRKLSPFLDSDGFLRVGGRLVNSQLSYDQKHPMLLPRQHRLTDLIIEEVHKENMHPGLQTLHHLLSQNFWILSPRRAIRHCLSKCIRCFRTKPISPVPLMGNLPTLRVQSIKPFQCVGVDYGGPFTTTMSRGRGVRTTKSYICLFVCFATKAIHLELASDLSTDAFLAAFRRFIGRRGRCNQVYCDCGGNFVGASKEMARLMKHAVETERVEFNFNPPSAPHFGGLWESGIKSVKTHFYRVVGNQILSYEEFNTVLIQIEALLNSRPLCPLSSDPNDLSVLTPGHFLTLEPLTSFVDPDLSHLNLNRLSRWQLVQRLHQDFWKRWRNEYLHTLSQRAKWDKNCGSIAVGAIVLIKDEQAPPLKWRLGRVEQLHPGKDGIVRVVTLRTKLGSVQRPVVKLCPLPQQ